MLEYFHYDLFNSFDRSDFIRFAPEFIKIISANIPTIESVAFLDPVSVKPADSSEESERDKRVRIAMEEASDLGRPVISADVLYLPFSVRKTTVIAELKGLDDYLLRKVGNDWLNDLQPQLIREFLLVKRANIDSLTGLLSSLHLYETLNIKQEKLSGVLLLLSVSAKGSNSFYIRKNQNRTVSLLKGFINERFPLYYIGQSCFAMICKDTGRNFSSEFAPLLLNFFKREVCSRVHVTTLELASIDPNQDSSVPVSEVIMKKAWAALHIASKRGPFAFCNASSLENLSDHPLAPPSKYLKSWVQKVARNFDQFSLLQFDGGGADLYNVVQEHFGENGDAVLVDDKSYMFLPIVNRKKISETAKKIITAATKKLKAENIVNAGIAIYSPKERSKTDMLLNCRKALCHAAFLDTGAVVICDAVSFNISGDIYYGDGDLVCAVREYKRGLLLDSKDGNLLNSLGVCYAQMNRRKDAVQCFERACKSKDDRFMALYNLGFEQEQHDNRAAIKSFSSALACTKVKGQTTARKDISFQLAVLCCSEKLYKKGLALLQPWYEDDPNGKCLKYLGEMYSGLGNYKKAMKYLQLAMRYDEYDAEVLGLLGEIYLQENEGDDIALRFCEKAVELSPDSLSLKIRLAKAQMQWGDLTAADKSLQPCLRNRKTRLEALRQKATLAKEQGNNKAAARWLIKAKRFAVDTKRQVRS
jgi:tetratricopeptide (TPR) repeat protein